MACFPLGPVSKKCDRSNHKPDSNKNCASGTCQPKELPVNPLSIPCLSMGRSPQEARRLQAQGKIYAEPTGELLRMAGVRPGMRILDVGCGARDVTLRAAAIAGSGGSVLGVDEDREVLAVAAQRAQAAGLRNVSFKRARVPDELSAVVDEPVDAVVGRLILLHLEDPAGAVAALKGLVRPGGLLTFQDFNVGRGRCVPPNPLMDLCMQWITKALAAAGAPTDAGDRLL